MIFPSNVGVELNLEPGERGTPHPTSVGGRVRSYVSSHIAVFVISAIMGVLSFFIIATDTKYTSLGSALGNGFGALIFFGSSTFFIGLAVQMVGNFIKRQTFPDSKQKNMKENFSRTSDGEDKSYLNPPPSSPPGSPEINSPSPVQKDLRGAPKLGRIFISYRREDASHTAGRLSDRLIDQLGDGQVFIDVDSIELGVNYRDVISNAVGQCDVPLAIIGNRWFEAGEDGRPRLFIEDDLVRVEIEAALRRGIRVIPVLADGAAMPKAEDLPESLSSLAHRNALQIRHETFRQDAQRLLQAVQKVLQISN